jgi:hypothetical protein
MDLDAGKKARLPDPSADQMHGTCSVGHAHTSDIVPNSDIRPTRVVLSCDELLA